MCGLQNNIFCQHLFRRLSRLVKEGEFFHLNYLNIVYSGSLTEIKIYLTREK